VVEHEYPKARIQDKERLAPILQGSIAFTRKIDEAAACMFALQSVVLKAQGIPVQGHGRQAYRSGWNGRRSHAAGSIPGAAVNCPRRPTRAACGS
jgi:hypothetical protein